MAKHKIYRVKITRLTNNGYETFVSVNIQATASEALTNFDNVIAMGYRLLAKKRVYGDRIQLEEWLYDEKYINHSNYSVVMNGKEFCNFRTG